MQLFDVQQLGLAGTGLEVNQLSQADLDELANSIPILTYGQPRQAPPAAIPAHVAFDKKVSSGISVPQIQISESLAVCRKVSSKP